MINPALIGALSNAIRGAQWKAFVPAKYHWISSDALNVAIYALTVYYVTGNYQLALLSAPAMWVGAMVGWGDYIGALGGWRKDNLKEWFPIDVLIGKLRRWPRWWGFAGLTLRGIFWAAWLATPFFMLGYSSIGGRLLLTGLFMGAIYGISISYAKSRIPEGDWQGMGWGLGEILWGFTLWSALGGW